MIKRIIKVDERLNVEYMGFPRDTLKNSFLFQMIKIINGSLQLKRGMKHFPPHQGKNSKVFNCKTTLGGGKSL